MTTIRLFATAADAARTRRFESSGVTVAAALDEARSVRGPAFCGVLETSRVWLNGDQVAPDAERTCGPSDDIAVLPPVSGG